jgi:hypothetical protein
MANEAIIVQLLGNGGDPVEYTCASGTAIAKGCVLKLTDPRTASASSAADVFAGIAAAAKADNDDATTISAYTYGIFDMVSVGPAITAGAFVSLSGANMIKTATEAELAAGNGVGKALETSTASGASGGEVIEVLVGA